MTRTYRPMRIVEVIYGGDYQIEKKTTLQYIRKYGYNKPDGTPMVRGAGWAGLKSKPPVDSEEERGNELTVGTSGTPVFQQEDRGATECDLLSRSLGYVFQEFPRASAQHALPRDTKSGLLLDKLPPERGDTSAEQHHRACD